MERRKRSLFPPESASCNYYMEYDRKLSTSKHKEIKIYNYANIYNYDIIHILHIMHLYALYVFLI